MKYSLDSEIRYIPKVGEYFSKLFFQKDIITFKDALFFFPKRYEDRSTITNINDNFKKTLNNNQHISTFLAKCIGQDSFVFNRREIKKFIFKDEDTIIEVPIYNPQFRFIKQGKYYFLTGKINYKFNKLSLNILDYEIFENEDMEMLNMGRIVPIYSSTSGLPQTKIRYTIRFILDSISDITYDISENIINKYRLIDKSTSIKLMHFPDNYENLQRARASLVFEEFYHFQKRMYKKKLEEKIGKEKNRYKNTDLLKFLQDKLSFKLTDSQIKVLDEIKNDLFSKYTMNRMVQGDVGCGKTIIAILSSIIATESKKQVVIMAPTDMLARQHYFEFSKYLKPLGIKICLFNGSISITEKKKLKENIERGNINLIIGTHALLYDINFFNLTYVIIDEEHKFGVDQKETLKKKGDNVDYLVMSATPIPRSLSLSVFANLDISIINELPKGRLPVKTKVVNSGYRDHSYKFLLSQVSKGNQGYVVFPAIEDSSVKELKAVKTEFNKLKKTFFKDINIEIVHGKTELEKREKIMNDFNSGKIKILFTTTVIEVGIDNPNATVMIVESAEMFGLAQLHQLRGRIGRGKKQGYIYYITHGNVTDNAVKRLGMLEKTTDGFRISEADLEIRGPGQFFGVRQSGMPEFKLGNIVKDYQLLQYARIEVEKR